MNGRPMSSVSKISILEFEVYVLMTMKIRMTMSQQLPELEAKLAEHTVTLEDAERLQERIAQVINDETARFDDVKELLGIADQGSTSLKYSSVLWPEFDFTATAGDHGRLESARYWHARLKRPGAATPIGLPMWSMDVTEFTQNFGPMRGGR